MGRARNHEGMATASGTAAGAPAGSACCRDESRKQPTPERDGGGEGGKRMLSVRLQDQSDKSRQVCSGMYSRKSWGGNVDPFILVKMLKPDDLPENDDPIVSLIIFEWKDRPLIGKPNPQRDNLVCRDMLRGGGTTDMS